ncbi:MAG: glycosyltransferase family 2 protein [Candidatus Aquicultorales bacterium]
MVHISLVVPVYNAEHCLEELYGRLVLSLELISLPFEIIFVEDCGSDNSWLLIEELAKRDERVKAYQLSRNFGQHAATLCGIANASGQWIVTIDDDLEQSPEDIRTLYLKAIEGYALVYGVYEHREHSKWRNATSAMVRGLFKLAIPSLNYDYTSFRIINGEIARSLSMFDAPFPFIDGYLSWVTNKYAVVKVQHSKRQHGKSNYTLRKLVKHTMNIFATFSELPLKVATWLGLSMFAVGLLLSGFIVIQRILGGITVSGYTSLMASVIIFGGIQLFVLGILGEYIGRINFKTSHKPVFVISKDVLASTYKDPSKPDLVETSKL